MTRKTLKSVKISLCLAAAFLLPLALGNPAFSQAEDYIGGEEEALYPDQEEDTFELPERPIEEPVIIPNATTPTRNIVSTLAASGNFNQLVAAFRRADLIETFQADRKYTFFAPSDAAFEVFPEETLDRMMEDEQALRQALLYHVVPGEYTIEDIRYRDALLTFNGNEVPLIFEGGEILVGDARIVHSNVQTTNGLIHVIDAFLTPPRVTLEPQHTVLKTLEQMLGFDTFIRTIRDTGIQEVFDGPGPITVFVPTNEAFASLEENTFESLVANPRELRKVLLAHVMAGNHTTEELKAREDKALATIAEIPVSITSTEPFLEIDGARVINDNIGVSNGTIHVIDDVLTPPVPEEAIGREEYDRIEPWDYWRYIRRQNQTDPGVIGPAEETESPASEAY